CHLDPSAEIPLVAMAMDATMRLVSPRGERLVPMSAFAKDIMTTALEPDELLAEIRFPIWPAGTKVGFREEARRHGDFAIAAAAVLVARDSAGRIERIAMAMGGVTPTPHRLAEAERAMLGRALDATTIEIAASAAQAIDAMTDATYPAWYRQKIGATMLRRVLTELQQQ
ncbi:MAG: FAD binding domain-containing protein, partial [Burkholderiales bacterium]